MLGLSLSFRSTTGYERYNEGRKYWAQLSLATQSLARLVWVHAKERPESEKEDLLGKVALCNMLVSFAVALKHRLRFEPYTAYGDLGPRIQHLKVMADAAETRHVQEPSALRLIGLILGLSMAESNPRELTKDPKQPLGNIPLEILTYCSTYIKSIIENGTLATPIYHTQSMTLLSQMNDVLTGTERIVSTPLPIAYTIALSQVTWVYILLLPFQLIEPLGWVTIPATMFAAYVILGTAVIGCEIENPFGKDVNDLPMDHFCAQIERDISIITSHPAPTVDSMLQRQDNLVLYPVSHQGYSAIHNSSIQEIRDLLSDRPGLIMCEQH